MSSGESLISINWGNKSWRYMYGKRKHVTQAKKIYSIYCRLPIAQSHQSLITFRHNEQKWCIGVTGNRLINPAIS